MDCLGLNHHNVYKHIDSCKEEISCIECPHFQKSPVDFEYIDSLTTPRQTLGFCKKDDPSTYISFDIIVDHEVFYFSLKPFDTDIKLRFLLELIGYFVHPQCKIERQVDYDKFVEDKFLINYKDNILNLKGIITAKSNIEKMLKSYKKQIVKFVKYVDDNSYVKKISL